LGQPLRCKNAKDEIGAANILAAIIVATFPFSCHSFSRYSVA